MSTITGKINYKRLSNLKSNAFGQILFLCRLGGWGTLERTTG